MEINKIKEYEGIYRAAPKLLDISSGLDVKQAVDPDDGAIIFHTGRYVFAPVLNSFVLHVLTDAINKGIKQLFFLARDAYFYYLIAEKYVKEFGLDIQCKYLYVSRFSLRVPLYHLDIEQALSYITLGGVDVTPTTVINRAGLSESEGHQFAEKLAMYLEIKKDEQITRHRLPEVRDYLKGDKAFIEALKNNSEQAFANAKEYLEKTGFITKEKIAIVDSGWVGSIQVSLNQFRRCFGITEPLEGYYFGLYEIPPKAQEEYYHYYLFGPRTGLRKKVLFNNCLFECIFSAPHGMTLAYDKQSDKNVPILSDISQSQVDFLNEIRNVIETYQDKLIRIYDDFDSINELFNSSKVRQTIENALFSFMSKPSMEEAKVFGQLHFSDDVIDYDNAVLAAKLSEEDLYDNHFLKRVYLELREMIFKKPYVVNISGWYEGSVMLYSKPENIWKHLFAYTNYKYYLQYSKRKRWMKERKRDEISD